MNLAANPAGPSLLPGAFGPSGAARARRLQAPELALVLSFVAMFVSNLAFGQPNQRITPITFAVASFTFLLLGFCFLLLRHLLLRDVFLPGPHARRVLPYIVFWFLASISGSVVGVLHENSLNYLVGDVYKNFEPLLIFFLAYFCFRRHPAERPVLRLFSILFACVLLYIIITSFEDFSSGARVYDLTVAFCPFIVTTQLYLFRDTRSLFSRLLFVAVLVTVCVSLIISQTRIPILLTVIGMGAFLLLGRATRSRISLLGLVLAIGLVGGAVWYLLPLREPMSGTVDRFDWFVESVRSGRDPGLTGGVRLPEVLAVGSLFRAEPEKIFFGFGLGSSVETEDDFARASKHYIHVGLAEITYRMGVIGLSSFAVLNLYLLLLAYRKRGETLTYLATAVGIQQGVNTILASPFVVDTVVYLVYGAMVAMLDRQPVEAPAATRKIEAAARRPAVVFHRSIML